MEAWKHKTEIKFVEIVYHVIDCTENYHTVLILQYGSVRLVAAQLTQLTFF